MPYKLLNGILGCRGVDKCFFLLKLNSEFEKTTDQFISYCQFLHLKLIACKFGHYTNLLNTFA